MSKIRSYKTYFRSPTGRGGFKLPRRTTHRILEKSGKHKTTLSSANVGTPPRTTYEQDDLQFDQNEETFQRHTDSSEGELNDDEMPESVPVKGQSSMLFNGAKISVIESCPMVYGFANRHKLSKSALSDLLTLLNFHLPKGDSMATSPYLAEKLLGIDIGAIKKICYCERCSSVLISETCQACGDKFDIRQLVKGGKYFLSLGVKQTIESTLQHEEIKRALYGSLIERRTRSETQLKDIMDGSSYKKLVGLWFGDKKPNFEIFLQPFLEESKQLATDGVNWTLDGKAIISNVYFPMVAADSPARCQLQGINQYNGEFSCPWCLEKGETYWIDERRHKWIFPAKKAQQSRTQENFKSHLRQLRDSLCNDNNVTNVFGIKAPSKLILLPKFDMWDVDTLATWMVINLAVTSMEITQLVKSLGIWRLQQKHPFITLGEDLATNGVVWWHWKNLHNRLPSDAPTFLQINHDLYENLQTSPTYHAMMLYWNYRLGRAVYERDADTLATWMVINLVVTSIEVTPLVKSLGVWQLQNTHPLLTLGVDMATYGVVWWHWKNLDTCPLPG
ncbi:hypothetical protein Fcan01_27909 [Folsomia candida]|uniref:Uncharacterized protein n=1 Tax=Folsomia candida TaxID=158441 RepID=A0A226CXU3_FOLCA|nr:hypothetical protein Fcan01_27909 [Folsomia candida]